VISACCGAETYADPTADPYGPIEEVVRCSECDKGQTYGDMGLPGKSSQEQMVEYYESMNSGITYGQFCLAASLVFIALIVGLVVR
jgi:hypothetical protein